MYISAIIICFFVFIMTNYVYVLLGKKYSFNIDLVAMFFASLLISMEFLFAFYYYSTLIEYKQALLMAVFGFITFMTISVLYPHLTKIDKVGSSDSMALFFWGAFSFSSIIYIAMYIVI